jgi:hypothetical protein
MVQKLVAQRPARRRESRGKRIDLHVAASLQPIHVRGSVPEALAHELDPSSAETPLRVRVDLEELILLVVRTDDVQFRRGAVVVADAVFTRKTRVAWLSVATSGSQHCEPNHQSPELERDANDVERYARRDHLVATQYCVYTSRHTQYNYLIGRVQRRIAWSSITAGWWVLLFGLRVARFFIGASEHRGSEGFGATHFRVGAPPRLLGRQFIRNSVKRLQHFVFQAESDQRFLGRGLFHRLSIYSVLTRHNNPGGEYSEADRALADIDPQPVRVVALPDCQDK